ncbi:MAG: site-2 protease family protein [Planctomycetota bacterium]
MSTLSNLFSLAFAFLVLVSFHELGHYLAAKWAGVKVHKFALGFPPWIFSIKLGETVYCLGITLMGGFVRMQGEEMIVGENETLDDRDYRKKPIWKRAIIILAGPVFSLILAFPIYLWCMGTGVLQPPPILGPQPTEAPFSPFTKAVAHIQPAPGSSADASSAAAAGAVTHFQAGDRIVELNGSPIFSSPGVLMEMLLNGKSPVQAVALRDDPKHPGHPLRIVGTLPAHPQGFEMDDPLSVYQAGLEAPAWQVAVQFEDAGLKFRTAVMVMQIMPEVKKKVPSPAIGSALLADDEIVALDGQPVAEWQQVLDFVQHHGDKPLTLQVRHADHPAQLDTIKLQAINIADADQAPTWRLGVAGQDLDLVTAVDPGSAAAKAGIQPGMAMLLGATYADTLVSKYRANPIDPRDGSFYTDHPVVATTVGPQVPFFFCNRPKGGGWNQVATAYEKDFAAFKPDAKLTLTVVPDSLTDTFFNPPALESKSGTLPADWQPPPGALRWTLPPDGHAENQKVEGFGNILSASSSYYSLQILLMLESLKKIGGDILHADRRALSGLAGPVGIGGMLMHMGNFHDLLEFNRYLLLIAFISINLGFMNLLPIPILDGGHLLMLAIEAIRRRRLTRVFVERFQIVGMVILLGLFLLATCMDLYRFF